MPEENPTGIISQIEGQEDKVLLAPLDAPKEIKFNEALIINHPGGEVTFDLTYTLDSEGRKYVRQ